MLSELRLAGEAAHEEALVQAGGAYRYGALDGAGKKRHALFL